MPEIHRLKWVGIFPTASHVRDFGGAVASTVLDHVTGGLRLYYLCIDVYMPGSLLHVLWSWYLATFLCRVCFCALIIMIASGSLVIDICFKVSWGDRWGAEPRSVRWSGGLRFG